MKTKKITYILLSLSFPLIAIVIISLLYNQWFDYLDQIKNGTFEPEVEKNLIFENFIFYSTIFLCVLIECVLVRKIFLISK